jgi:predicted acylesterase/phospholipase RssA
MTRAARTTKTGTLATPEASLRLEDYTTLRRIVTDPNKRFIVSLGGGSVPGLAGNAALVRLLEELGLREHIGMVWGTSAGAVIGGGWASGTPALSILELIASLDRRGGVDVAWVRIAAAFLFRPFGARLPDAIVHGRHFVAAIDAGLKVKTFEECEIPFRCIACEDDSEIRVKIFRKGPLLTAITGSMSLPGVLTSGDPDDGLRYFDGGLLEKTPLISPIAEHSRSGDARELVLLCSHFGIHARPKKPRGFVERFMFSLYAMEDKLWDYQLEEARRRKDVTLMFLDPKLDDPKILDFSRVYSNYADARASYLSQLHNSRIGLTFGLN